MSGNNLNAVFLAERNSFQTDRAFAACTMHPHAANACRGAISNNRFDIITAIAGIEMVLKGMGHPVKLGTGVAVAQELLMAREDK